MRSVSFLLVAVSAVAGVAQAQSNGPSRPWTGMVGLGAMVAPRYSGGDDYRVRPIPFIQVEFRNRVFAGVLPSGTGVGLGSYLHRGDNVAWTAELAASNSRDERYGDALAGMGDRSGSAIVASGLRLSKGIVSAGANVAIGLDSDEGSLGTFSLAANHMFAGRWMAGISTGATVADSRNMTFDFGITPDQASRRQALIDAGDARLRSGDGAAYSPRGGLKQMNAGATVGYAVSARSRLVLFAQRARLSNEAAQSSIVRERESTTGGLVLMYGF